MLHSTYNHEVMERITNNKANENGKLKEGSWQRPQRDQRAGPGDRDQVRDPGDFRDQPRGPGEFRDQSNISGASRDRINVTGDYRDLSKVSSDSRDQIKVTGIFSDQSKPPEDTRDRFKGYRNTVSKNQNTQPVRHARVKHAYQPEYRVKDDRIKNLQNETVTSSSKLTDQKESNDKSGNKSVFADKMTTEKAINSILQQYVAEKEMERTAAFRDTDSRDISEGQNTKSAQSFSVKEKKK